MHRQMVHTHTHAHTRTPLFLTPPPSTGGATPLHRAAYSGHTDIAQLLINSGADVRLVDSDGKTALHKVDALHTCSPLGPQVCTLDGYLDQLTVQSSLCVSVCLGC